MIYVLVDISYLIFYRYFALIQWWKHANADIILPENPYACKEFLEKFEKMIKESIIKIKEKLKLKKAECKFIGVRDCPRKNIWRNEFYDKYKENRDNDKNNCGMFFKHVYDNNLLHNIGLEYILLFDKLEADDIIATIKKYIHNKYPNAPVIIIANDHDYLQLLDENTEIVNLQFKKLRDNSKVYSMPDKNLFYKILLGDKSDNIPPVFNKCGPKTVEKYYMDSNLFNSDLDKLNCRDKYDRNRMLIDFNNIPKNLLDEFIEEHKTLLDKI